MKLFEMQQVKKAWGGTKFGTFTSTSYSVRKQATDACCVRSTRAFMVDTCNIVVHTNLEQLILNIVVMMMSFRIQ